MKPTLLLLFLLSTLANCAYEPELSLTAQPPFLNRFISHHGHNISELINNATIPDLPPIE